MIFDPFTKYVKYKECYLNNQFSECSMFYASIIYSVNKMKMQTIKKIPKNIMDDTKAC